MDTDIHQLKSFCERWLRKANYRPSYTKVRIASRTATAGGTQNSPLHNLNRSFDRFISLYVVFNRVYTEVGKVMVSRGQARRPREKYAPLPDKKSATIYVVNYYGEARLRNKIQNSELCRNAVDELARLIQEHHFYLHENYETGMPDIDRDEELALQAANYEPRAILQLIYQARCNLFHGAKAFEERQRVLLDNMSIILKFVTSEVLGVLIQDLKEY